VFRLLESLLKKADDKHVKILSKYMTLQGEILKGREPIKGKDSRGHKPDQFVNEHYRMHDLIRGIYAPKKDKFALSIMLKDRGRYGKEITYFGPQNWAITYHPPQDKRGIHDIEALKNCLHSNVPIGILRNIKKSTNEVLGLGKIIDVQNNTFSIVPFETSEQDKKDAEKLVDNYLDNKISQEDYSAPDIPTTAFARRGQRKFRKKLLLIYGRSCAFCGFDFEEFLIASHVVPYADDALNRLNPRNGLLLCRMCDVAFERGFLKITSTLKIIKVGLLKNANTNSAVNSWLLTLKPSIAIADEKYKPLSRYIRKRNKMAERY